MQYIVAPRNSEIQTASAHRAGEIVVNVPDGMTIDEALNQLTAGRRTESMTYSPSNPGVSTVPNMPCMPYFPDSELVCQDPAEYMCAGAAIVPSVFFVFFDPDLPALPLVGPKAGTAWIDGDFRTLGNLERLRSTYNMWTASEPHTAASGLIAPAAAVGGALPFPVYKTAAPAANVFSTTNAPLMGFGLTFGLLNVATKPQFQMQIDTVGFQTRSRGVSVDRTGVIITVQPWMYDSGFIVVLFGLRVKTETAVFMPSTAQADPATITLTFPTNIVSSVIPTVTGLQPDADFTQSSLRALHNMAVRNRRRRG